MNDEGEGERLWHYIERDVLKGPLIESELVTLLESGALSLDTPVWTEELPDWHDAEAIQNLVPNIPVPKPQSPEPEPEAEAEAEAVRRVQEDCVEMSEPDGSERLLTIERIQRAVGTVWRAAGMVLGIVGVLIYFACALFAGIHAVAAFGNMFQAPEKVGENIGMAIMYAFGAALLWGVGSATRDWFV